MKNQYEYILKAAEEIWLDNGMINVLEEPLNVRLNELLIYLNLHPDQDLFLKCETLLSEMDDETFTILTCGENDDILDNNIDLDKLLNEVIFNEGYKKL